MRKNASKYKTQTQSRDGKNPIHDRYGIKTGKMVKIEKAAVAVTFDKNKNFKFLILKKKGNWEGWQFVQGHIDKGETEEQAVLRELKEETGLDGEIVKKLDMTADYWFKSMKKELVHKFLIFFLIKADKNKKIKISIEHSDWKWVDYETALEMIKFNKDKFKLAYEELKKIKSI